MGELVNIHLDLSNPVSQTIWVSISWIPDSERQVWSLPQWTPGSYTIRDHAQHLFSLKAYQNNKEMKGLRYEINSMMSKYDIFEKL